MHIDAVVPLTGLSFNAVCMFFAETTLWLSLQYLLIDAFNGHRFLSHIFFPACGLESDRTSQIRLPGDIRALVQMIPASSDLIKAFIIPEFRNFMVTKRFSRTDSTENQSCLQLLRRCTYQVTSRLSSCLTTTLLTYQLISLLAKHSACLSWNFIAMNFIIQSSPGFLLSGYALSIQRS